MLAAKKKLKKKTIKKSSSSEVTEVAKPLFEFTQPPRPVPGEKLLAALQQWGNGRQKSAMSNSVADTERRSSLNNAKDLRLVFKCVNSSSTGFLNEIEVHNARELLGLVTNDGRKEHIRKFMESNSGSLSFEAFQKLVSDWNGLARNFYRELKQAFSVIDTDNDGRITAADLREASKLAGLYFTNKELEDMLQVADKNGDGTVDISEFIEIMLKTNLF
ncbi:PREDICTED: caltractin-like [Nanorana parkeri]|uniref:caltractin-like n=1 Tax=Nanorana parkeri TaxID=125878 RepID=UPI000853F8FA|nr:PREDICTED: caltractin-like [Nanorana parkeri]